MLRIAYRPVVRVSKLVHDFHKRWSTNWKTIKWWIDQLKPVRLERANRLFYHLQKTVIYSRPRICRLILRTLKVDLQFFVLFIRVPLLLLSLTTTWKLAIIANQHRPKLRLGSIFDNKINCQSKSLFFFFHFF